MGRHRLQGRYPASSASRAVARYSTFWAKGFFAGHDGRVAELSAMSVNWANGAAGPQMEDIPGSDFRMKVDMVIIATGFEAVVSDELAEQLDLAVDDRGRPVLNDYRTSVEGVFAAGDLVTGPAYVVTAIHSGRQAAARIDRYLARLAARQAETAAIV